MFRGLTNASCAAVCDFLGIAGDEIGLAVRNSQELPACDGSNRKTCVENNGLTRVAPDSYCGSCAMVDRVEELQRAAAVDAPASRIAMICDYMGIDGGEIITGLHLFQVVPLCDGSYSRTCRENNNNVRQVGPDSACELCSWMDFEADDDSDSSDQERCFMERVAAREMDKCWLRDNQVNEWD